MRRKAYTHKTTQRRTPKGNACERCNVGSPAAQVNSNMFFYGVAPPAHRVGGTLGKPLVNGQIDQQVLHLCYQRTIVCLHWSFLVGSRGIYHIRIHMIYMRYMHISVHTMGDICICREIYAYLRTSVHRYPYKRPCICTSASFLDVYLPCSTHMASTNSM
jgi:hypothetical protein